MNILEGDLKHETDKLVLIADKLKIMLPEKTASRLADYSADRIKLGIRPEKLMPTTSEEKNLSLKINVVENIGPEYLVYSFQDQGQIVIKTPHEPTEKTIHLAIDDEHLHLFDQTGNRIG